MMELHENRKAQCWSYTRTGRSNAGATREQEGPMLELHENRKVQCRSRVSPQERVTTVAYTISSFA